jgi:pimeloyl-[acyl-carrier protein] methyl ester esterase
MSLRLKRDYPGAMGEFFKRMFSEGELSGEQYQMMVKEIVIPGRQPAPEVALQGLDILAEADLRQLLPMIDIPVLLLHGSEDTICPCGASGYMAERIPNVSLDIFNGCGHAPFISRPGEFNQCLERFLERFHARD